MAKIRDEEMRFTVVINGNEGQKAIRGLEKANRDLDKANDKLLESKKKLKKQGKENSKEWNDLTKKIEANRKSQISNRNEMAKHRKELGLNNLTMRQLQATAGRLRFALKDVMPNGADAKKYNKQLLAVNNRMRELRGASKATGGVISQMKSQFKTLVFPVTGLLLFVDALKSGLRFAKQFITDAVQLSIEAKGVEFAFKNLGDQGEDAFNRVKIATRGLLSDLEIKRSLVEFDNFNISLEESATLFEFLTLRATQTGVSVDKLKQSLVEGLSKESKLRIDNLGISAKALNAELEKTPNFVQAVANIAKKEIIISKELFGKFNLTISFL